MKKLSLRYLLVTTCILASMQVLPLHAQSVCLTWTASNGDEISHYNIYRTIHPDSGFQFLGSVNHPDTVYIDDDIYSLSRYYYAATAVDNYGYESDFSNIFELEPSPATPVELSAFTVRAGAHSTVLVWSTNSESNNYGFEVQRSKDHLFFEAIGFVHGHGTTTSPHAYRFEDDEVHAGTHYYRLKQIDLSGYFALSEIIQISLQVPDDLQLYQNYPNPFNPSTTITYTLPKDGHVALIIYNSQGQKIATLVEETQAAGYHSIIWDGRDQSKTLVPSGLYYYHMNTSSESQFRKMLLLK